MHQSLETFQPFNPNLLTLAEIETFLDDFISDPENQTPKNHIQKSADHFLSGQDLLTKKQASKLFAFLTIVALSGASIYVNPAWDFALQHKDLYIDTGNELSNIIHCVLGTSIPALALLMIATWTFFLMRKSQNVPEELSDFLIPPLTEAERKRQDILTGIGSGISAIILASVTFAYGLPGFLFAITIFQAIVALVDNLILHFLPLLLALTKWYFRIPFIILKAIFYSGPKLLYDDCCNNEYEQIAEPSEDEITKTGKKTNEELITYYSQIQTDILLEKLIFDWRTFSYKLSFSDEFKTVVKENEIAQNLKAEFRRLISNQKYSNSPTLFDQQVRIVIEKALPTTSSMDKRQILDLLKTTFSSHDLFLALNKEFPRKFTEYNEKTTFQQFVSTLDYMAGKLTGFLGSFWVAAGAAGYVALPVQIFLDWTKSNLLTILIVVAPEYFFGVFVAYCGYQISKNFYDLATKWGERVPKLPLQFKQFPPQFIGLMAVGVYFGLWSYAAAAQLILQFLGAEVWDELRPIFLYSAISGLSVLGVSAMKDFYKFVFELYALYFTSNEEKKFVEKLMVELTQLTQAMQNADPLKSAECKEFLVENNVIKDFVIKNDEPKKQSCWEWSTSFFRSAPDISKTPSAATEESPLLSNNESKSDKEQSWTEWARSGIASLVCCSWMSSYSEVSEPAPIPNTAI